MKHQINESHLGPDATPNDAQRVAARLTALGYPCEYNPAQGASRITDDDGNPIEIPDAVWFDAIAAQPA